MNDIVGSSFGSCGPRPCKELQLLSRICLCFDMVMYLLSIDPSLMCPLYSPLCINSLNDTTKNMSSQVLST